MAASAAVYRHEYAPRYKSCRKSEGRFSLIVRLPEDGMVRLKNVKDGVSVQHVKKQLELHSGFTQSMFTLCDINGDPVDDDVMLRLGENISDNAIMKLLPNDPYADVYEMLTNQRDADMQMPELPDQLIDKEVVFNILFMSASLGIADYCKEIIANQDVALTDSTSSGNTCLHAAAAKDQVTTAMMLCSYGAELYQKNKKGETALDVALEFGSFTCERKLRLSQWTRRKAKLKETEYSEMFTTSSHEQYNNQSNKSTNQNRDSNPDTDRSRIVQLESENTESTHKRPSTDNLRGTSRPSTAMQLLQRPPTRETPRRRMSEVNHEMPEAAVEKKKERIKRSKSAPLLNADVRNQRLCRVIANKNSDEGSTEVKREKRFTLSRPQFLQYIKSSTGVVEEDYFADIFPEQDEKPKDNRSFDDQMKRNERIFKKMFKESGVCKQCSDTDSEEEMARQYANKRAVRRWNKKKQAQKREEQKKKALLPTEETEDTKRNTFAKLLMIGDTSGGRAPTAEPATYIRAYQECKESRAKSAVSTKSNYSAIDPVTYEEWVVTKPHERTTPNKKTTPNRATSTLTRRIDYNTWLESANRRIRTKVRKEKREEQQKKDFEEWIEELKEEVGTFEYWRKRKEEQLAKERQLRLKKEKEEKTKSKETVRRRELAKDIYRHWAVDKEMSKLKSEQAKLEKEKERLKQARQTKR